MTGPLSPCSVPDWLRLALPLETPEQQERCRRHDERYAEGGTHEERLITDLDFARDLLDAKMAPSVVEQYFWGVRQYGGLFWAGGDGPGARPMTPPPDFQAP